MLRKSYHPFGEYLQRRIHKSFTAKDLQSGGGGNRTRVPDPLSVGIKGLTEIDRGLTAVGQRSLDANCQLAALSGTDDVFNDDPSVDYIRRVWPYLQPHIRDALLTLIDAALLQQRLDGGP